MTMAGSAPRVRVGGPWFEDFAVGQVFDDAPALTLGAGHAALHQAIAGDRLRLALDEPLCRLVTGRDRLLAHPNLVCDVAIGQSTGPTQRVRGNLFYRGLVLQRPVFLGDTLGTRTEVVALKQNRPREGAPATGLVVLRIRTTDQDDQPVLDFWRCPMLPLRDPDMRTGHADAFDAIPAALNRAAVRAAAPAGWRLEALRARAGGPAAAELAPGAVFDFEGGETVTAAPELARLTLNVATAHTDATGSAHGRRLVYGGHTISIAAAHVTRALPDWPRSWPGPAAIIWVRSSRAMCFARSCASRVSSRSADGGLVDLRALVSAHRPDDEEAPVLDWRFVALVA